MGDLSKHFSLSEFACRCCGLSMPHPRLIAGLEAMRANLGRRLVMKSEDGPRFDVSSGTRCQARNIAVGGAQKSPHVPSLEYGRFSIAADIQCEVATLEQLLEAAVDVEDFLNGGIGLYVKGAVRWIHVDVRHGRARWGEVDGKKVDQLAVLAEDDRRRAANEEKMA